MNRLKIDHMFIKTIIGKKENWAVVVLIGILLLVIAWPVSNNKLEIEQSVESMAVEDTANNKEDSSQLTTEEMYELRLKELLQTMEGVGEVEVMVTLQSSKEEIIEKETATSRSNTTEDAAERNSSTNQVEIGDTTVYLTSSNGEKIPYVIKELSPVVEGVSVVCTGGADALIQKNITDVIQALFGVEAHKIKVVKMKKQE
ncbi:MAG: stage III sporulation protein AG [Lachnospiraceae bacterium]